jgi:GNAT superfamily N-acetyltransferase
VALGPSVLAEREPVTRNPEVDIVPFVPAMRGDSRRILSALPNWFGIPTANDAYVDGLDPLTTLVARSGDRVVGFVALQEHFPESAEIHVLAVHPDHRRTGIGRALLARVERALRGRGVELLHVKTLGPSDPYPPYAETRAFYSALGFRPLFESPALWGPENPALVLVKHL